MKIAIMQPYFFPYIGYWQLLHAADLFILFDDPQYIRHGWINRNRILKPEGGWQYIIVPLKKHALTEKIKHICVNSNMKWEKRIIGQLAHYKKYALYYYEVIDVVGSLLADIRTYRIVDINLEIIKSMSSLLGLQKKICVSSALNFNYEEVGNAGEWALRIAEQIGAKEYINPVSGANLFDETKFNKSNIKLSFLNSHNITYNQINDFIPSLSIIDVLMFNGISKTRNFLSNYHLSTR